MAAASADWGDDPIQSMSSMSKGDFSALMDKTFGKGKWRLTGGYRSPARENELRREGAETVAPGHTSAHSEGTQNAPGAYDVVVDGLTPTAVADRLAKSGHRFAKLFPEGASGTQGGHLHVQPYMTAGADDWGDDPIVKAEGAPKPPGKPSAPPRPAAKPTPRQKALAEMGENQYARAAKDIGHEFMEAGRATDRVIRAGEQRQAARDKRVLSGHARPSDFLPDMHAITDTAQLGLNSLAALAAPVSGLAHTLVGRPVTAATDSQAAGRVAENAAGLALPVAGEARLSAEVARIAREEGVSEKTAREIVERSRTAPPPEAKPNALKRTLDRYASDDPAHRAAVERLKRAGVKPAAHQEAGGSARRIIETAKSNPYIGEGVREAESAANDSLNRALYNKVLEPLGEKVSDKFPVGRDGVRAMKAKMDAEYEAVKPHIRVMGDGNTIEQLATVRTAADKLGEKEAKQFEAILNQDVLHHFAEGGMDGNTYKKVEGDLLRQARGFKSSQDPNQRELGRRLEDVVDVLRQDMVDHSPAKYRARIQATNAAYARYVRLRDAASRRANGGGHITPGDLLAAVKKGDHSVGKGDFATGDALLQDFAEDADRVLSPKVSDSGTTERALANRMLVGHGLAAGAGAAAGAAIGGPVGVGIGGVVGAAGDMAASRVTNALAKRLLTESFNDRAARNYLKSMQAARAQSLPPAALVGAAPLLRPNPPQP